VTGGVKTPVTPTRFVLQRLLASGEKTRTPAFFSVTTRLITPWAFDRLVMVLSFAPLIRTRTPFTALPCLVTWIVTRVLRPTNSWFGLTLLTATQKFGGVCGPTI